MFEREIKKISLVSSSNLKVYVHYFGGRFASSQMYGHVAIEIRGDKDFGDRYYSFEPDKTKTKLEPSYNPQLSILMDSLTYGKHSVIQLDTQEFHSQKDLEYFLKKICEQWGPETYERTTRNCSHFVSATLSSILKPSSKLKSRFSKLSTEFLNRPTEVNFELGKILINSLEEKAEQIRITKGDYTIKKIEQLIDLLIDRLNLEVFILTGFFEKNHVKPLQNAIILLINLREKMSLLSYAALKNEFDRLSKEINQTLSVTARQKSFVDKVGTKIGELVNENIKYYKVLVKIVSKSKLVSDDKLGKEFHLKQCHALYKQLSEFPLQYLTPGQYRNFSFGREIQNAFNKDLERVNSGKEMDQIAFQKLSDNVTNEVRKLLNSCKNIFMPQITKKDVDWIYFQIKKLLSLYVQNGKTKNIKRLQKLLIATHIKLREYGEKSADELFKELLNELRLAWYCLAKRYKTLVINDKNMIMQQQTDQQTAEFLLKINPDKHHFGRDLAYLICSAEEKLSDNPNSSILKKCIPQLFQVQNPTPVIFHTYKPLNFKLSMPQARLFQPVIFHRNTFIQPTADTRIKLL